MWAIGIPPWRPLARPRPSTAAIDVLVNNAGITKDRMFLKMTREDWDSP